jgi:O-antigen/teichoic acid export membrane protein
MSTVDPGRDVELPIAAPVDIIDTAAAGPAALRGGMLRTGAFVGGLLLGLASAPILVRYLGDADFGRYAAVLAVVVIVSGMTEGGVNTIALRELAALEDGDERNQAMSDLLGLRLALSTVGIVAAVGFVAVAGYGSELVLGTLLASVGMVAIVTQTLVATALQSRLRFGWAALLDLLRQAMMTALIIVLVLVGAGVVPLLATTIPAGVATLVLTVILVRGGTLLRPAFHPRRWLGLLRETIVVAFAVAVNALYFRIALVVMAAIATATETGEFAISFRIMEVLVGIPLVLVGAAFPIVARTARSDQDRFAWASGRLFELSVYTGALLALALLLVAPFAIEVLAGSSDHPSVGVLEIQSTSLLASFAAIAATYPLLGIHRHREALIANCLALAAVVALTFALVPDHGAEGAAIAVVVADFTLAVSLVVLLMRDGGPKLPLGAVPVALLAALCGYGAGYVVGIHPIVQSFVGSLAFLAVLALLGRFPPEVRELLSRKAAPAQ